MSLEIKNQNQFTFGDIEKGDKEWISTESLNDYLQDELNNISQDKDNDEYGYGFHDAIKQMIQKLKGEQNNSEEVHS